MAPINVMAGLDPRLSGLFYLHGIRFYTDVIPENASAFIRDLYGYYAMAFGTIPDRAPKAPFRDDAIGIVGELNRIAGGLTRPSSNMPGAFPIVWMAASSAAMTAEPIARCSQ